MRRFCTYGLASLLALIILTGCITKGPAKTADGKVILKVATLPVPHSDILAGMLPMTEQRGLAVEMIDFDDPRQADLALAKKQVDVVYAQTGPELEAIVKAEKLALVSIGPVHLDSFVFVSTKMMDLTDVTVGSRIAIPGDPIGTGRALKLLAQNGLVTLRPDVSDPTLADLVENPQQLVLEQVETLPLPRRIAEYDAAILSSVQFIEARIVLQMAIKNLALESAEGNPHAAVLVVRKGDEDRPEIKSLKEILTSTEARLMIKAKYQGRVIPAE